MKKNIFKSFTLSLVLMFTFLINSTLVAAENSKKIRVGYIPYDDLVIDINRFSNEGYGYEILKKVEEKSDLSFEFVKIDGDIFKALENGEVDIIGFYFHTPERAAKYLYLKTPLNSVQTSLIAPTNKNRIYDNPVDIDGKTIATYKHNIANSAMEKYAAKHNISVKYVVGDFHNYKKLKADYYLAYSSDFDMGSYNNVINFDKRFTYLISLPDKEEMMDKLNKVVYEIVTTEGNFFEQLGEKYMGAAYHTFHRSLKQDEIQILRKKTLKVAYNEIAKPLTFTDPQGKADGVLIDVMNKLAQMYEFNVEYHPYSYLDPKPVLENCDIALSVVGDSSYYKKHFTPSECYIKLPILAMVPKEKISGKISPEAIRKASPIIGSLSYLYTNFGAFLEKSKENSFEYFENFYHLLDAYKANEVDLIVFTQFSLGFVNTYLGKDDSFTFAADFDLDIHLNIANDIANEYVPIFNIMLDNISQKEYNEILIKNEANHFYEQKLQDLIIENWYNVALFAFALLSIILSLAFLMQRKRKNDIQRAHDTDARTSLMSLYKFSEEATKRAKSAPGSTYELISFDIDMFKTINIHFGDEQGTKVIENIGKALQMAFKTTDALLCRKTSDHFLIFRSIGEGGTIQDVCNNFILPKAQEIVGEKYNLSLSFGLVTISDVNESANAYLGKAENARIQGKNEHQTTFITFDENMQKYYENKLSVTYRMKEALNNREFSVVYQPKVDFNTLKVGGAEALVRWFPKEGRPIFPDEFIPVFEQNGFILSLDLYVLEEVCRFLVENEKIMEVPTISVNLSAHSILGEDLIARIAEIIYAYDIDPKKIEFELTESAIESNTKRFLFIVQELKECGFGVSIDDFGAGVSSLNRLSAIDAHVLKLDKAFFDLQGKEEKSKVVVKNVITMAKELDMMVVAEGVEIKEQAVWLKELKSDYAQGYYFAKPMNEDSFKELLQSQKVFSLD